MEAQAARADSARLRGERTVPLARAAVAAATVAYGLIATAGGTELGTPLPPLLARWDPRVGPLAAAAPHCSPRAPPWPRDYSGHP